MAGGGGGGGIELSTDLASEEVTGEVGTLTDNNNTNINIVKHNYKITNTIIHVHGSILV